MLSRSTIVAMLRRAGCVYAEDEADLLLTAAAGGRGGPASPAALAELGELVARRVAGQPLEYILGWAGFAGLRILVEPTVFVPRQRTELLVRAAAAGSPPRPVVVDLCCGTGALGVAFAALVTPAELHATDLDPAAVHCARRNVEPLGGRVYQGDLFSPLPDALRGRVDVLLANAPYVPTDAVALMPPEARDYEARAALDGGDDGLDVLRRVLAGAPEWLSATGRVLLETSDVQSDALAAITVAAGLTPTLIMDDERDATALVASRPPPPAGPTA